MRRLPLAATLILYLLLAVATSVIVPLGEAPDEVDHFLYVRYLVQHRAFPVMNPVFANNDTLEANQPPLYYLLGALAAASVHMEDSADFARNACFNEDPRDPGRKTFYRHSADEAFPWQGTALAFHLVRFLSILLGGGAVLLSFALARQAAAGDERVATAAAALLAFNPQFIFITASANNDNLAMFLGAAIVFASARIAMRPRTPLAHYGLLGLLVGLGALAKFSLLGFWPIAFLAVLIATRAQRRARWSALLLVALVPLFVAGWWYWRSFRLYGDPLAWQVHLAAKGQYVLRSDPFRLQDLVNFTRIHFQSYWGWFGWLNIKWPAGLYLVPAGVVGAALLGAGKAGWAYWSYLRDGMPWSTSGDAEDPDPHEGLARVVAGPREPRRWGIPAGQIIALLFAALAVLVVYALLLRYVQTINWSGYQGRLAFPAAAPMAVLLAAGLVALRGVRLALVASIALLLLAAVSLVGILLPAYPRPQIYQPAPQLVSFAAVCPRYAGGLQLEGYSIGHPATPGVSVPVTVYGYGLSPSAQPASLGIQIAGREGMIVGEAETALTWQAGEVVSKTLHVAVSEVAQPARGVLRAGLTDPAQGWEPATSALGRILEAPVTLGPLKIAPTQPLATTPDVELGADFAGQLALLGYDLAQGGSSLSLTVYWQATSAMDDDYTVFVHLFDADGNLLAQNDAQPHQGWYPTSIWAQGEVVADHVTLDLPAKVSSCRLALGVYKLDTGERLPVTVGGVRQQDDQVVVPSSPIEGSCAADDGAALRGGPA